MSAEAQQEAIKLNNLIANADSEQLEILFLEIPSIQFKPALISSLSALDFILFIVFVSLAKNAAAQARMHNF